MHRRCALFAPDCAGPQWLHRSHSTSACSENKCQSSKYVIPCCTGGGAESLFFCASKFGILILLRYKNLFIYYGILACHRIDHSRLGGMRRVRFVPLGYWDKGSNSAISFTTTICKIVPSDLSFMSVCPHSEIGEPLNCCSSNFMLVYFINIYRLIHSKSI